jgi:NADH-quinone oxidoreductase E subunit
VNTAPVKQPIEKGKGEQVTGGLQSRIEGLFSIYPNKRAALMIALHFAQKETGWLSNEAIELVSESIGIPKAMVKGVASFYTHYRHLPSGRNLIQLCTNVSCMLFGAERVADILAERYSLVPGSTSTDGRFSLQIMECIGACDKAPAMLVNEDLHCGFDETTIHEILGLYK